MHAYKVKYSSLWKPLRILLYKEKGIWFSNTIYKHNNIVNSPSVTEIYHNNKIWVILTKYE